jgi:CheY-like chemotaxis protein
VRSVLERYGYSVVDAKSGGEALRLIDEQAPVDLAIVDAVMRNMSGRDLVKRLRAGGHRAKVLYMTGHLDAAVNVHATFGQERVLRKAFSPSELLRNVRRVLDAR